MTTSECTCHNDDSHDVFCDLFEPVTLLCPACGDELIDDDSWHDNHCCQSVKCTFPFAWGCYAHLDPRYGES